MTLSNRLGHVLRGLGQALVSAGDLVSEAPEPAMTLPVVQTDYLAEQTSREDQHETVDLETGLWSS